jgi:uncharacterized LabA/DUF88 family protein
MIKVAILVDGGFYHHRCSSMFRRLPDYNGYDIEQAAELFRHITTSHVNDVVDEYLYRILYYDAHPMTKIVHNPLTGRAINLARSDLAIFRRGFFEKLKHQRKVALRLGETKDHGGWKIHPKATKELLNGKLSLPELSEDDIKYDATQKGVDMKIGLDIASLAYKKLVDKIVLISGDSDFVPAAKVARREGIDVVLDPMWNHVEPSLFEHIDGTYSTVPHPGQTPGSIAELLEGVHHA